MPKELVTQSELEDLKLQHQPSFAPFGKEDVVKVFDSETGITQRRLSNGISVNYKVLGQLETSGYFSRDRQIIFTSVAILCSLAFVSCFILKT